MTTVADIMLDVAELLGGLVSGISTGGSTTTLVDASRNEPIDYWRNGTLFVLSGANSGLASPILSFEENTFKVATQTNAIVSGLLYSAFPSKFSYSSIFSAIRSALNEVGDVVSKDDTLVVDSTQYEYTLPSGVSNVYRIEVGTTSSAPYDFSPSYYWFENGGMIVFDSNKAPSTSGMKIRVWYRTPHPAPTSYSSSIASGVNLDWLRWASVVVVYRDYISKVGNDDPIAIQFLNQALVKVKEVRDTMKNGHDYLKSIDSKLSSW